MNKKQLLLGLAVGSLMSLSAHANEDKDAKQAKPMPKNEQVTCQQNNSCSGKGSCGGVTNSCRGKNTCSNHKFMAKSKGACTAGGGTVVN
ncbi:MAG: hypothetical protein KDD50_12110 [Bdellovibrionales bacterium]|nr:hypothetical protein [Bdellovibrionales bacterium]